MTSIVSTVYRGYCPKIDAYRQIVVEFLAYDVAQSMNKRYRKRFFKCPDSEGCPYLPAGDFCPLAREVPNPS
ncbi:MAG: hypothetical protein IKN12_06325 [Selenomonadaceae bacterium]|nr:hypothetical protein [Selenomonadaceae bacterium]